MNLRKPLYGRNESTEDHGLHVRLLVVVVHKVLEGLRDTFLDFRDRLLRLGNLDGICDWDGSVWVAREEAARDRVETHIKPLPGRMCLLQWRIRSTPPTTNGQAQSSGPQYLSWSQRTPESRRAKTWPDQGLPPTEATGDMLQDTGWK